MKIAKSLSWIIFASAFSSLSKWLIVILIARNLTVEEVGIYTLAFAIAAPITLFANMKLRSLYITSTNDNISDYFYARNILSVLALVFLIIISLIFYQNYIVIILLVGFSKILDLQSDLYYSIPHKNGDLDLIGKMIIVKQLVVLLLFAACLLLFENLAFAVLIQIVTQILFLVFLEKRKTLGNYNSIKNKTTKKAVQTILVLGLPLGLVQMMFSINTNYSRYVLEYFEDAETLGYFAAIMYIITIFNLLMNSISQVFLPKLSKLYISNDFRKFQKYLYKYLTLFSLFLSIILVVVAKFFGQAILILLYGIEYGAYSEILFLVSVSVALNMLSWNFDTALMAMRYISIQPKITFFNLLITAFFGYIFISNYGIKGAAYTLIISSTILLILRVYFVNAKMKLKSENGKEGIIIDK